MVIVKGNITVDPEQLESYLAGSVSVVEKARRAAGCLDFAMTADLLDPARVNLFERWESQAAVKAFCRRAPRNEQGAGRRARGRLRRGARGGPRPRVLQARGRRRILDEIDEAAAIHRRLRCPVLDVTTTPIEESAQRVIELVKSRLSG